MILIAHILNSGLSLVKLQSHQNLLAADLWILPMHFYGNATDFLEESTILRIPTVTLKYVCSGVADWSGFFEESTKADSSKNLLHSH